MIVRDVEHIEVIAAGLDLRTERGLEAEQREDVAQLFDHLRDWMSGSEGLRTAW